MSVKIALAGNPNSGKTTLFNALTGSNQFVGNWPGVTVEKKEGRLKGRKDVIITDLPGIYSLSPYTLEEVVARNYLLQERPDAILNIVDGTNIERNLYLSTQLMELGIPVVMAVNMMDLVKKNGDVIHTKELERTLGCPVIEISALKGTGIVEAADMAVKAAESKKEVVPVHQFSDEVEAVLDEIEAMLTSVPESQRRFYAIKLFERDDKISLQQKPDIEELIQKAEEKWDDDSESIITNERYVYISSIIQKCCTKNKQGTLSISDKIDRIVTNRWLALPIFAVVMFIVYYVSVSTVGTIATDWANDGVFGDGWYLFGIGRSAYEEAAEEYEINGMKVDAFIEAAEEDGISVKNIQSVLEETDMDESEMEDAIASFAKKAKNIETAIDLEDEDGNVVETLNVEIEDFETALQAVQKGEPKSIRYSATGSATGTC